MATDSKVLIVFAQAAEAQSLIRRVNAVAIPGETTSIWSEGTLPCRYEFEKGWIVISGVGIHAAQMAAAKYAYLCDEIWNIGLAGSLKAGLPLGEVLSVETVGKYIPLEEETLDPRSQECVTFTLPHIILNEQKSQSAGTLISSDFPIHDTLHRDRLGKKWDLVDMEGYGIAFATHNLGKKCRIWKIISDFASPGGRDLIRKYKIQLSEKIADTILEHL